MWNALDTETTVEMAQVVAEPVEVMAVEAKGN